MIRFFSSTIKAFRSAWLVTVRGVLSPFRSNECFAEKNPLSPRLFVTFVAL